MRRSARERYPSRRIQWLDDRLPGLDEVHRLWLGFDLILLSAVWMHVKPADRHRAFRKLATLLKPGGLLIMSLREGPSEPDRPMWPAPVGEIEALARIHGLSIQKVVCSADELGRPEVRWTTVCLARNHFAARTDCLEPGSGRPPVSPGVLGTKRYFTTRSFIRRMAFVASMSGVAADRVQR